MAATSVLEGTLMFTDIEGSSALLQRLGDEFVEVIAAHHRLLRDVFARHGGTELRTEGDAFFLIFPSAHDGVEAAVAAQRALAAHAWPAGVSVRVRMGLHHGEIVLVDGEQVGLDIHRAARITNAAHGGQIVVSGETAAALNADGGDLTLHDLGLHWLKDLEEPEHVFEVGVHGMARTQRPLNSLGVPTQLPAIGSALVGRRQELEELVGLLGDPGTRLVTLTGPGGIGKTRLALAAAEAAMGLFPYGLYFVALADVAGAADVPAAVAAALGMEMPFDRDVLLTHVRGRRRLLVLDNFEHVLGAASFVAELLTHSGGPTVLVTSREPLRLRDELEQPVPPLALPPEDAETATLLASDAVALFVARARRVRRDLPLGAADIAAVAEICRRLDGLPLAIELVAARVKLLGPAAILDSLDRHLLRLAGPTDAPSRQRTLEAAVEWSHELLAPDEQRCFRLLSVFAGGFDLEAVEAVMAPHLEGVEPVDALTTLVDKSLVRVDHGAGAPRFSMLRAIHAYATQRCEDDPAAARVLQAHALHYLGIAEAASFQGGELGAWLTRIGAEHENLRAALARVLSGVVPEPEGLGLRLALPLGRYWYQRGQLREGVSVLREVLDRCDDHHPGRRAPVLHRLGVLLNDAGERDAARATLQDALGLAQALGDDQLAAAVENSLGVVEMTAGDLARGRAHLEAARALRVSLGDDAGLATTLTNLAELARFGGETQTAATLHSQALALDRRLGNRWGEAVDLLNLSAAQLADGKDEPAAAQLTEALAGFDALGDRDGVASCLAELIHVARPHGDPRRAALLAGSATALFAKVGSSLAPVDQARFDRRMEELRAVLGDELDVLTARGAAMTDRQAAAFALGRRAEMEV